MPLLALPGVTPGVKSTRYIASRAERSRTSCRSRRCPPAQGFLSGAAPVWRIARRGDDARWCNLRPRRRRASAERSAPADGRAPLARGRGSRSAPPRPTMHRKRMERANPDFGRWLKSVAQRSGLRAFWRWWVVELAPLMPAGRAHALLRRRRLRPDRRNRARGARCCGRPASRTARSRSTRSREFRSQGDPGGSRETGHAAIDALPRATYGRHDGRTARRDRASGEPGAAQGRSRLPRQSRRICIRRSPTTSTGTRRSRPTKCISTRRSSAAIPRRKEIRVDLGSGAQEFRRSGAAARGILGRRGRRRHPRIPDGRRGARRDAR